MCRTCAEIVLAYYQRMKQMESFWKQLYHRIFAQSGSARIAQSPCLTSVSSTELASLTDDQEAEEVSQKEPLPASIVLRSTVEALLEPVQDSLTEAVESIDSLPEETVLPDTTEPESQPLPDVVTETVTALLSQPLTPEEEKVEELYRVEESTTQTLEHPTPAVLETLPPDEME